MSFRKLIEPDCGGVNPLIEFENQLSKDLLHSNRENNTPATLPNEEFLGPTATVPLNFRMDALIQEMCEIEKQNIQSIRENMSKTDEFNNNSEWTKEFIVPNNKENSLNELKHNEFGNLTITPNPINLGNSSMGIPYIQENVRWDGDFFGNSRNKEIFNTSNQFFDNSNEKEIFLARRNMMEKPFIPLPYISQPNHLMPMNYGTNENVLEATNYDNYFDKKQTLTDDWLEDFSKKKDETVTVMEEYSTKFWDKLQNEWQKIAKENSFDNSWLAESDTYDPYKEYQFIENNPMQDDVDALEKGKQFLAANDIPNAVLCFESAVKQNEGNAEAWELLGISQAENEMDPHAIAALKKALELKPNDIKILMALAVSYTNESLQYLALKMLIKWMQCNPKYSDFVKDKLSNNDVNNIFLLDTQLKEIQNLFIEIVQRNPKEIDSDIQEALGILFTLSSEYDKAADCFRTALQILPNNAKLWNRLGASLANGNRSIEAVEAYKNALDICPGYIRARYNVGIVCMNLKAYKEAVEHLLVGLNLQATSAQRSGNEFASVSPMSDTIWSTLRMIISLMGKWDLQEAIDKRDLNKLNEVFSEVKNVDLDN